MSEATLRATGEGHFLVEGNLNFHTVPNVWRTAQGIISGQGEIEIDLGGVSRCDSAGLALMVAWRREGERVRFRNVPAQLVAIARASGVDQILGVD